MDYAGLGALFEGAASGIETGTKLGLLVQGQRTAIDLKNAQIAKDKIEAQKTQQEVGLAKIGKITDMYKEVGPETKPILFKAWANQVNSVYGTTIDPESAATNGKYMEDFGKLITARQKGTLGEEDFLHLAGELRTKMDKEQSAQTGGILNDLPEGINSKKSPEKTTTAVEATKRITEIQQSLAKIDQTDKVTLDIVTSHPELAAALGKPMTPELKAQMIAAASNEIQTLNASLPPERQLKAITRAEYNMLLKKHTPAEIFGSNLYLKE